ncbi:MAG: prephenate dehydrogenase/arogenate dehydrogenase family protein [Burkholderiales bacterium]|nr:prephenate dehydrogenase/arogenate dehydrogenase family protein [Burkholderiales bacterium]
MINKLTLIGVGLIGGSFALALREAGLVREVVGVGRSAENLSAALGMYVIDAYAEAAQAVQGADVVLLAVPVGQMGAMMSAIAPYLAPNTIVTDVGSTKQDVVALARANLSQHLTHFVPGHPIAGAEQSGVKAARGDLFRERNVVLTPLPETNPAAKELIAQLWQSCGAKVSEMAPALHDEVFAAVSHLPHLLAFGLVDYIAAQPNAEALFGFAASGFRDFTRIAGSSPEMWRDICLANRDALLQQLAGYEAELARIKQLIERGDSAALAQLFVAARDARQKHLKH